MLASLIGKDTHERLDHMGLYEQGVPLQMDGYTMGAIADDPD